MNETGDRAIDHRLSAMVNSGIEMAVSAAVVSLVVVPSFRVSGIVRSIVASISIPRFRIGLRFSNHEGDEKENELARISVFFLHYIYGTKMINISIPYLRIHGK